ncbi:MAG: Xaa-Pro peptidase family protein [Thermofilum sp.]|nr:Xaa-Pro peptidase family protein [Thermofilum sp.]
MSRRKRVLELVESRGLDAVIVLSQSNIFYLTSSDAPSAAVLFRDGRLVALAPRLEYLRALEEVSEGEVYAYARFFEPSEYEKIIAGDLYDALASLLKQEDARALGAVGAPLEARQKLSEKLGREPADITKDFATLRRSKDQEELRLMRQAVAIAEEAMRAAVDSLERGVTEVEVLARVLSVIARRGALPSFTPIVAFGEHSAHPHAKPSARELREGDLVKLDLGARVGGYCSDITRTFVYGKPSPKQERLFKAVLRAQQRALEAVAKGAPAKQVFFKAYDALKEEGLHTYFNHGLGHGVGIDIHEAPTLNSESDEALVENDVVTVEPGVYLAGYGGVRIEDMVLVVEGGYEELTRFAKDPVI